MFWDVFSWRKPRTGDILGAWVAHAIEVEALDAHQAIVITTVDLNPHQSTSFFAMPSDQRAASTYEVKSTLVTSPFITVQKV